MKRPLWIIILATSVILNLSFLAGYAYQKFSAGPEFVEDGLNLTPERQARVIELRDRFLQQAGRTGGQMGELHGRLIDAIAAEPHDPAAVEAAFDQIRQCQREMQQLVADHLLSEKRILTPEQRAAFFSELKERMRSQAHGPRWLSQERNGWK
jgi:Spy/CpxP family protein refolding chaperone